MQLAHAAGSMMSSAPVIVVEIGNSAAETVRMVPPANCRASPRAAGSDA